MTTFAPHKHYLLFRIVCCLCPQAEGCKDMLFLILGKTRKNIIVEERNLQFPKLTSYSMYEIRDIHLSINCMLEVCG